MVLGGPYICKKLEQEENGTNSHAHLEHGLDYLAAPIGDEKAVY
jgi:hypothetical protein